MLRGKKILLGVCGSIAAYKAAELIRLLVKARAEVQVIATTSACTFITPLTLSTLSKRPVLTSFTNDGDSTGTWNNHVELGLWADLFLIAPASANTMAKCAHGICDNLLTAVYLSARCPVVFAPAMDLDMYSHPSTRRNARLLKGYGHYIADSSYGELASGLVGRGRMREPEELLSYIQDILSLSNFSAPLQGKKILITAGPTYEPIDPVRFIGNRSTGKMGYAIAEECARLGGDVTLISGPTHLQPGDKIQRVRVDTAESMYNAASRYSDQSDIIIMAAAVADYKPAIVYDQKIKKEDKEEELTLSLHRTRDIAAEIGKRKGKNQISVGFALETNDELQNARKKILSKNLDFIVLNSLNDPGAGFGYDTNKITIIDKQNKITTFELKSKKEAAADIVQHIVALLNHE